MSVALVTQPIKTINGITSNVTAAKAQMPFEFLSTAFDFPNYKVNVEVLDLADSPLINTIYKYSPKADGTLFIDLGHTLTEINELFLAPSLEFKLRYWETYTGFEGNKTIIGPYMSIYANKQLLSVGGANMWEYLLNSSASKLLTKFGPHKIWNGISGKIGFVVDSGAAARLGLTDYIVVQTSYDINGVELSHFNSLPISLATIGIHEYLYKITQDPIIGIKIRDAADTIDISEEQFYHQAETCANPIVLEWINSLGAWENYLFNHNQLFEYKADVGTSYQSVITQDIEIQRRTKVRIVQDWVQQIILQADDLNLSQLKGLQEINSSNGLRVWLNSDGTEWVGVVVSGLYASEHSSKHKKHEISVQIELPDNFDLELALNYTVPVLDELVDSDGDTLIDADLDILIG